MKLNDRLLGGIAILAGIAVIAGTLGFREIPGQQFGSAFFPRLIGAALILTGVALMARRADGAWLTVSRLSRGRAGLKVVSVFAAVLVWVLVSPVLGFIATTALLIALLIVVAGGRPVAASLTGVGMALVLHLVFAVLLRVPLPFGVIERMMS